MPVYSPEGHDLFEEFKRLCDEETEAIKTLHEYMQRDDSDWPTTLELGEKMETLHGHKIKKYKELQQYRID